jgi:hypothetical protein
MTIGNFYGSFEGVVSRIIKKQHNMTSPLLVVEMCAR